MIILSFGPIMLCECIILYGCMVCMTAYSFVYTWKYWFINVFDTKKSSLLFHAVIVIIILKLIIYAHKFLLVKFSFVIHIMYNLLLLQFLCIIIVLQHNELFMMWYWELCVCNIQFFVQSCIVCVYVDVCCWIRWTYGVCCVLSISKIGNKETRVGSAILKMFL